jgi:hypothetical protein
MTVPLTAAALPPGLAPHGQEHQDADMMKTAEDTVEVEVVVWIVLDRVRSDAMRCAHDHVY